MWLNEGFATYFAHLWMEKARGEDWGAAAMLRTYARVMRADGKGARPLLTRFYNEPGESRANPYSKGACVLQMLRVYLGDEVFFSGIQKYTRDHQHSAVETIDLRRAFEAVSGERLDWFFDQWVFLAGHPKISVSHRVDSESGDVFVTLRQTQKVEGLTPSFILPVDLPATMTFQLSMSVQEGCPFDSLHVRVNGEPVYTMCEVAFDGQVQLDLGPFAGGVADVVIEFDTADEFANEGDGAYVDDVVVSTCP